MNEEQGRPDSFKGMARAWLLKDEVVKYIVKQKRESQITGQIISDKFDLAGSFEVRGIVNWYRRQGKLPAICTSNRNAGYWGSSKIDEIKETREHLNSRTRSMNEAEDGLRLSENKARIQNGNR